MGSYLGNEETLVELPALHFLLSQLDYEFIHGEKLTPEYGERESINDVILEKRLEAALKRLNPWLDEGNLTKAIRYVSRPEQLGSSLLEINEKLYEAFVNLTYALDQDLDHSGKKKFHTVKFFDWENIENNDFLVTRQFVVQGPNEKIKPDMVIFVNGTPVVVLECKSPFLEKSQNENIGKREAYEQLSRYMDQRGSQGLEGAPRLFYTNFFTGILNKYHAYVGTISSKYSHYLEWKDPYPFRKKEIVDVENSGQNLFLQGLLEKRNLLDIMQNFILFETDAESSIRIKKICRYQQFRAVNKALQRLIHGRDQVSRGGVIWHTQGSGKSLTMVFLARKIRRVPELSDATIVVVTDRVDLDKQIYGTFLHTLSSITTPVRAESVDEMKELLSKAQSQIVMTTIHKFQADQEEKELIKDEKQAKSLQLEKEFPILTLKSNVIVLADEAHRSQYKGYARNMRKGLPNAAFIGFTGTPIEKEDKSTQRTFGGYIDKYSIQEAVEDGATVRIVYEGRKPKLHIKGETLEELFDQAFKDRTEEEKEMIKKKYVTKQTIVEADERIEEIAKDMLQHYKEWIYPNGFKAQVVCVSREACVKYYHALTKHMKEIMGEELEVKIIFSGKLNDQPHLKAHFTTKPEQENIIKQFVKPISESKLCFLIVKDMLLTGFDAPIEQVMYLDRPLKEHNLLQAIARVNRTHGDKKKCGYVVDYYGISNHLDEALQVFNKEDLGTPMESLDGLYKQMLSYREAVMVMFHGIKKDQLDDLVKILEPEDKRAEFELAYKRFASAVEQLMPGKVSTDHLNDLKWLSYIRAAAKARFQPEKELDISDCGEKVRKLVSDHLKSHGVEQWIQPITLFDHDYNAKLQSLQSDEAIASSMEHTIRHVISVKMDDNPVYYTSLLEKLQRILDETKQNWAERKKRMEEFIQNEVETGETAEAEALGLNNKEYAFYEVVKAHLNVPEEQKAGSKTINKEERAEYISEEMIHLSKEIAQNVAEIVETNYVIDWTTNSTKTADVERAILMMLTKKYFRQINMQVRKQLTQPLLQLAKKHYATKD
ncbi:type I restriction endonuclease subunit R [Thermoflavimicrobium daqui]|uniref:Type I restriction enzyme endonuclease subunit n=1 Tax=Thermoflavimicrobium daqui TaxID=2137476 RepID=A0A364K8W8_9BACL|nr:type I restriction endonuclease subunit R [Thermoflavimicrobium daqui]RAL26743.1 type I restriction endonuclease subunit R [Thermoflavimicrobium daqui]